VYPLLALPGCSSIDAERITLEGGFEEVMIAF
jgi:hypothetical protein